MTRAPLLRHLILLVLVCTSAAVLPARATPPAARTFTQTELFQPTTVWTAHLTFARDQWVAIQPVRGHGGGRSGEDWLQGQEGKRNGWGVTQGLEFEYVHADLEFDNVKFANVGVRFKGNGTFVQGRPTGKVPFKIDLNKYVKGQKIAGVSTINFHNNVQDAGWMNEPVAYRLYRDAGIPSPRTSYVKLFVTVTGEFTRRYLGLYSLVENVDTNFIEARFKTNGGAILKPSTVNPFTDRGTDWAAYNQTYDPKTDLTAAETARIIEFCQFVSHATDADFRARIGDYIDLPEFARYFAVLIWLANPDSMLDRGQNYYVYMKPDTRRLIFIPWDQDDSFGGFARVISRNYQTWDIYKPWVRGVTFLNRISTVPAFRAAYLARMEEFSRTIFTPPRFGVAVAQISQAIRPAVADEPKRVAGFERTATGQIGIIPFAHGRTRSVIDQLSRR